MDITGAPLVSPADASRKREAGDPKKHHKCAHCGLPVPPNARDPRYCCAGCKAVAEILAQADLGDFYSLGGADGRSVGAVPVVDESREWLEAAVVTKDAWSRVRCEVQGIHCAACVWLLEELWRREAGSGGCLRVNPATGEAELHWTGSRDVVERWMKQVERLGYRVGAAGTKKPQDRSLLVRTGICVAVALNAMMFAFAGYFGLSEVGGEEHELFELIGFLLATVSVAVGGSVFFKAAWIGVTRRVAHLDQPIALGIGVAWVGSMIGWLRGSGAVYFDSVSVFVALMLVGRLLQQSALRRNRDFLLSHDAAADVHVRRLDGQAIDRVKVQDVAVGDRVLLSPGDLLPLRARLERTPAAFSLDWINGESRPSAFEPGAEVPAGAFLQSRSAVTLTVAEIAAESDVLRVLREPPTDRRPVGRFWELVNRVYVAAVLAIATLTSLVWAFVDPSRVVEVATAVLVVTCPCALGLAVPLATEFAIARLRRSGVYVRRLELFESARRIQRVVFDKTGTLTWGGVVATPCRLPEADDRDVLWTMVSSSGHPVAKAVVNALGSGRFLEHLDVEEIVGRGVVAIRNGVEYRLGGEGFALGGKSSGEKEGVCVFARDGHVEGCFTLSEDVRADAEADIARLRGMGIDAWVVSGDRRGRVLEVARQLGVERHETRFEQSPEDKRRLIEGLGASSTMMIGDGLNDAPAFEVAACSGTPAMDQPVMPSRADFFYGGEGVSAASRVIGMARRLRAVVVTNLGLAVAYNGIAVALAAAGFLSPLICAVLMPASSLLSISYTATAMRGEHG